MLKSPRELQVCSRLPAVSLEWKDLRRVPTCTGDNLVSEAEEEGEQYKVGVSLHRVRGPRGRTLPRVYAPRFPKVCSSLWTHPYLSNNGL